MGLEGAERALGAGTGEAIERLDRGPRAPGRDAGGHLQRGALRHPQSRPAPAVHRQPHRQGGLALPAGGREGHDLRGTAPAIRLRIDEGGGPILHHPRRHPHDDRGDAADPARHDLRSRRGNGRLPLQRLPVRARHLRGGPRQERETEDQGGTRRGHGAVPQGGPDVRDEPFPARDRRGQGRRPFRPRQPRRLGEAGILHDPRQSAFRQEPGGGVRQRRGRHREGRRRHRARRLLDEHEQQAAQFHAAHVHPAEDRRPRRRGPARQRPFRGRSGREGAQEPPRKVQRPHLAPPAHRHLVFSRREGERAVL